jgi:hypothetical protein
MEFERARRIPFMLPQNFFYRRAALPSENDEDYEDPGQYTLQWRRRRVVPIAGACLP